MYVPFGCFLCSNEFIMTFKIVVPIKHMSLRCSSWSLIFLIWLCVLNNNTIYPATTCQTFNLCLGHVEFWSSITSPICCWVMKWKTKKLKSTWKFCLWQDVSIFLTICWQQTFQNYEDRWMWECAVKTYVTKECVCVSQCEQRPNEHLDDAMP